MPIPKCIKPFPDDRRGSQNCGYIMCTTTPMIYDFLREVRKMWGVNKSIVVRTLIAAGKMYLIEHGEYTEPVFDREAFEREATERWEALMKSIRQAKEAKQGDK